MSYSITKYKFRYASASLVLFFWTNYLATLVLLILFRQFHLITRSLSIEWVSLNQCLQCWQRLESLATSPPTTWQAIDLTWRVSAQVLSKQRDPVQIAEHCNCWPDVRVCCSAAIDKPTLDCLSNAWRLYVCDTANHMAI